MVDIKLSEAITKQAIIEKLRKTSQYELALQHIAQISSLNELSPELVTEIIRIMLLTENYNVAIKYFNLFLRIFPKEQQVMDEEVFLRLKLDCNSDIPSVSLRQTNYEWIRKYKEKKVDLFYRPAIKNCQIATGTYTSYKFILICQCCGEKYPVNVNGTLLIKKFCLCPRCLAKQLFTFEDIRNYIKIKHPEFISKEVYQKDLQFLLFREKINYAYFNNSIPVLAAFLNQDLIFALTELVTNEMLFYL